MQTCQADSFGRLLESLTGQTPPLSNALSTLPPFPENGLGYSQLNELLLCLGYDRVTRAFFQYLVDGTLEYKPGSELLSIENLRTGVERARQMSLLFFGNVKFGFKKLARDANELAFYFAATQPTDDRQFQLRHDPIHPVDPIPASETYYMGYLVKDELDKRLRQNPDDKVALSEKQALDTTRVKGVRNQHAYLVSDHLDVYVATSMRCRHEYEEVSDFAQRLFNHDRIKPLKLRWFDPTQAFCEHRIDKGLAEAPSRPSANTCCFFSSVKTLAMPPERTRPRGYQCPGPYSRWPLFW